MQIREQGLPVAQLLALRELRFLDLHHEIAARKDVCGALRDDRARRYIVRILEADAGAGAALDEYLMAGIHELSNARGDQPHPIFVNLDLFGDADFHNTAPLACRGGNLR